MSLFKSILFDSSKDNQIYVENELVAFSTMSDNNKYILLAMISTFNHKDEGYRNQNIDCALDFVELVYYISTVELLKGGG